MGRLLSRKSKTARRPVATSRPRPAFSYYTGDAPAQSDKLQVRHSRKRRETFFKKLRLVPTLFAVGLILLSVVYSTTLSTQPIIKFAGDDSPYRSLEDYQNGTESILKSSIWNHSKLTLNAVKTEEALAKRFPETDVVTVSIPIVGRRPTVVFHARTPSIVMTTSSQSFIVDESGIVIAETNNIPSELLANLLTVQDQSGLKLGVGDQALTTSTVGFIANVRAQLDDKKLTISKLVLVAGGYELDVYIKDISYFVKTDTSGEARLQIGAYLSARDSGVSTSEYIDVRVEEKIFYK